MSSSPYSTPPESAPLPEVQPLPPTSGRPTGVTVFAILNILFGITGILGAIISPIMLWVGNQFGPNPVADKLANSLGYFVFFVVAAIIGLCFSIVLLISGIGLLKMSKTARKLAIAYGAYAVISGGVVNVVNVFVIFMPMIEEAAGNDGPQQSILIGSIAGAVGGGCIVLIFPVALLIYFLRPSVKHRFDTWESEPAQ